MNKYRTEYEKWLSSKALADIELKELADIDGDDKEIESRFYAPLSFGTAGLRGSMGLGLNRMNNYVVRHATQGFSEVILAEGRAAMENGIVICYDCRINSKTFAQEAASVMAANGIRVRIFDDMRPTPELSFAILHYGAIGGINITASHNPKEYNGYKVYWSDGAQLPPTHAKQVADSMAETDIFTGVNCMDYDRAIAEGLITVIGAETDEEFLKNVMSQSVSPESVRKVNSDFKVVYTPFHGTGMKLVPEVLRRLGVEHVYPVKAQMVPDGSFPTVASPNPENPEGFYLAIELAKEHNADIIIATDPDADRVGVMAKGTGGGGGGRSGEEYAMITGNQMGVLLLNYLIEARRSSGTLPKDAAAIKTIVTTEMARAVAEANGLAMYNTFTGFKFMAEKIKELKGEQEVIFCYEESYGYMTGDFVRDKDAVTAAMLIAEMSAWYKSRKMTLFDGLEELYAKYGNFGECTLNLVMPGIDGLKKMQKLMESLRSNAPEHIGGLKVTVIRDYLTGEQRVAGEIEKLELSGSDVLAFTLEDGTNFFVRPSGTEPKIKVYILARGESMQDCRETIGKCREYAENLQNF